MTLDSPYKGLVPFEDTDVDALLFFGRERESAIIEENVLAARLTVLYGPSGVGKTSLLRAGVAHRLRGQARRNVEERGHPEFVVIVFAAWSDDDPVRSLLLAVREALAAQFGSALLDERAGDSLVETLERWTGALACDLLLVLDQVEEYFEYHRGEGGFAAELPDLVTRPQLRVRVLLSVRDDALAKLDRFKGQIPNLFANYLRLDHLDRRSAQDAITKPVERYNELTGESIEIELGLIEGVLEQTAAGRVDLGAAGVGGADIPAADRIEAAYLQLVLERLWIEERLAGSSALRAETLARLGGAEAIVRANLRRAVEELSTEQKDLAADIFRHLVTPSGAKIAHSSGDLAEYASVDETRVLPVLSALGRERIVRTVNGAGSNGARYEIFHDVLGEAVLAWRREQELERERRAAEKRHRRLAILAFAALLALAAMTAVAIYALSQRRDARRSAQRAQARELVARSSGLVARSGALLGQDPLQSIALASQAARLDPTPEAETALRDALAGSRTIAILKAGNGRVNAAAYDPSSTLVVTADGDGTARIFSALGKRQVAVLRHRGAVTDAAFSPDGRTVATASRDRTVKLWTRDGKLIRTLRHDAPVLDLAFSLDRRVLVTTTASGTTHIWSLGADRSHRTIATPAPAHAVISNDGAYLAVVGADRFARVYSLPSGSLIFELEHASQVLSAAFGPRKEMLVTGSANWTAQTWDLRRGRPAYRLSGHFGRVVGVAVSPQGQFVGTASADGTARIWNVATRRGGLEAIATGHTDQLHSISFSPSGLFFVTSSRDGTARVWKTDRGTPVAVLSGHDGDVLGASFSRTGRHVLTYGEDGTARIWDSGTSAELRVLARQKAPFTGLDLFGDGRRFVTTDSRGIARIWQDRSSRALPTRRVREASVSADGSLVATASADATARIWTASGEPKLVVRTRGPLDAVAFSPDGRSLATAGAEGVVLWRVADGTRERTLPSSHGNVDLSFSPEGDDLVAAGSDGKGRIWSVASGRLEHVLVGHRDRLTSARFSPDGALVVTASADHDARVWDAHTGHMRMLLRGHGAIVHDAAFSSDGRWIVTAGPGTAGVWEARTGHLLSLLRGHVGPLTAAEFVPGGYRVFTAGEDGTVRTYTCDVCAPLSGLLALADRRRASVG